mgnify:CR=1 FL=1
METILLIFIFLRTAFLYDLSNTPQPYKPSFKVLTYNIWNGYDFGKDEQRRHKIQQWINKQQADVVALQELCAYTPEKLQEDAVSWGHQFSILLKTSGYSVGITSKYQITLKEKMIEGLHHGAIHCTINGIDFVVVHLHPGSIEKRRQEARILLAKLKSILEKNSKIILAGDYNSHSPFDADLYDPDGYFLNRLRESNKGKGIDGNLINENLDYSVISSFLSVPMIDVVQQFTKGIDRRGTFPARVLGPVNHETDEQLISRLERIDYIFVSPGIAPKCTGARVYNEQDTWYLSDHYPVVAEFDFLK